MFKNLFAGYSFGSPFGATAMKSSRNLFGTHTTPRTWKHGARDIPFGMGAASLYVDDTDGNDSNDGESWLTAKKTIQAAVDAADSWTQIFVKAGTYAENVLITNNTTHLIGENRATTIITPAIAHVLDLSGDNCIVSGFTLKTNAALVASCNVDGNRNTVLDCILDASVSYAFGIIGGGDYNIIHHIRAESANMGNVCSFDGDEWEVHSIWTDNTNFGIYLYGDYHRIHDNEIRNSNSEGIRLRNTATNCSVYHNNLIGNTVQVKDEGSGNKLFENFYDDHTNVDNGFGIATAPYAYSSGTDHRPVVVRNGWNSISILRSLLRKKTAAQTSQAATNANGTAWVDLKSIAPTTSDIELYRLKMTTAGSWAGTAKYRIIVGSTKVYPFPADKNIDTGVIEDLIFPINVQINETAKIQFRSDNAADGAGETVALNQLDYATVL